MTEEQADRASIQYGQPVSYATQISDNEYKILWQSRTFFLPTEGDIIISPVDSSQYRVRFRRFDFLQFPLENQMHLTHVIVMMFPCSRS